MEASLPKYLENYMSNSYAFFFYNSMSPFATIRFKTTQSGSMAKGPIEELIEATSLEGLWPQKEICIKIF
jgi:hypothetical protein